MDSGGERRGEQMDAGAALGNVQADASLGVGVVGDFCAPGEFNGLVRLARCDYLNAARAEEGTEANTEGEGGDFFIFAIGELTAQVFAAVSGIEHHHESGWLDWGWGGSRLRNLRPGIEAS